MQHLHSSGSFESIIKIGVSRVDGAQLRRICEAIKDLFFEYSGADPNSSRLLKVKLIILVKIQAPSTEMLF